MNQENDKSDKGDKSDKADKRNKNETPAALTFDPVAEATLGDDFIIAAISQWTIERRSVALSNLTAMVRASSRRAWRERHPEKSTQDADIDWAESQYGADIGTALRRHMAERK
jgi:hypothetical protein